MEQGHEINDIDLSQLLNFGQTVDPMAWQETPRKALDGLMKMALSTQLTGIYICTYVS